MKGEEKHYLLLRDFLEPWARKFGISDDEWKPALFRDLFGADASHTRWNVVSEREPQVEVFGERYSVRGVPDERRNDMLFVVEIHPRSARQPTNASKTKIWALARGDYREPRLTSIPDSLAPSAGPTIVVRRAPDRVPAELDKLARLWREEGSNKILLPELPSVPPLDLLGRMRAAFRGPLFGVTSFLPATARELSILNEVVSVPKDDRDVRSLHAKLGTPFLEQVLTKRPDMFAKVVEVLRALPPPDAIIPVLVAAWRRSATDQDPLVRVEVVSNWLTSVDPSFRETALDAIRQVDATIVDRIVSEPVVNRPLHGDEAEAFQARFSMLRWKQFGAVRPKLFEELKKLGDAKLELDAELTQALGAPSVSRIVGNIKRISEIASVLHDTIPAGVDAEKGQRDVDGALALWSQSRHLWGAHGWLNQLDSFDDLNDALKLIRAPTLELLPEWFFRALAPEEQDFRDALMHGVARRASRQVIRDAVAWAAGLGAGAARLRETQRREADSPLDALKRSYLNDIEERAAADAVKTVTGRLGAWATRLAQESVLSQRDLALSLEGLEREIAELNTRAMHLASAVSEELALSSSLKHAHDLVDEIARAYADAGDLLGDLNSLRAVRRVSAPRVSTAAPRATEDLQVSFGHCISEGGRVRAPRLVGRRHDSFPLLLAHIPFVLRSAQPRALHLQYQILVPQLEGRPREWRELAGERKLVIEDSQWRLADGGVTTTIVVRDVPVPLALKAENRPFVIQLSGVDKVSNSTFLTVSYEFDFPAEEMPTFDLPFSDTTSPEVMLQHPLGVQAKFEQLLKQLESGKSSFLIAAPRRFGKTTLVGALSERASKDILVVGPVSCTLYRDGSSSIAEACKALAKRLGVHIGIEWVGQHVLPESGALDAARRRASEQGFRAIYLLFDEAQAMFAGESGRMFAEHLKVRIEKDWGKEAPQLAPIRIGLAGQFHLPRLLAGQMDGVFGSNQHIVDEIHPDHIERLVKEATRGVLQSTAEARQLVANVSRNFYILRFLLQEIRELISGEKEHRAFFLYDDVEIAISEVIKRAIRTGGALASYVLDPLNLSDNLTDWMPGPSYPVAIAWALASEEPSKDGRLASATRTLESWVKDLGVNRIDEGQVRSRTRELRDLAVLDSRDDFNSDLLRRFLVALGQEATPFRDEVELKALHALTVDRVRVPEERREIGRGGQATVYFTEFEGRASAIRTVAFASDSARRSFVETCQALRAIEGTRKRDVGYDALPVVRRAGFTDEPEPKGVVVYDWIEGTDLASLPNQLSEAQVVEIGLPLAEALRLLAQRRIVHRDVKPENVVLRVDGRPVLIDFGLAKLLDHSPDTKFPVADYVAPEVPPWTPMADVFALGKLCQRLAPRETSKEFRAIVDDATAPVVRRISVDALCSRLSELSDRLNLVALREAQVEAAKREAAKSAVFRVLAESHAASAAATKAGIFQGTGASRLAAQFLDEVFAQWTHDEKLTPNTHLSRLSDYVARPGRASRLDSKTLHPQLRRLCSPECVCAGLMRHANSHAESEKESIRRAKEWLPAGSGEPQLRAAVVSAAQRVAEATGDIGIASFVRYWLT